MFLRGFTIWDPKSKYFTLRFDFSVYGTSFGVESVRKLEEMVSRAIAAKDVVERKLCDSVDALAREEVGKFFLKITLSFNGDKKVFVKDNSCF